MIRMRVYLCVFSGKPSAEIACRLAQVTLTAALNIPRLALVNGTEGFFGMKQLRSLATMKWLKVDLLYCYRVIEEQKSRVQSSESLCLY